MNATFINAMRVPDDQRAYFEKMWKEGYDYVSKQQGFVASSLHRTLGSNQEFQYYTIAVWTSPEALIKATSTEWWIDFTERFGFTGDEAQFTSIPAICEVVRDENRLFTG